MFAAYRLKSFETKLNIYVFDISIGNRSFCIWPSDMEFHHELQLLFKNTIHDAIP